MQSTSVQEPASSNSAASPQSNAPKAPSKDQASHPSGDKRFKRLDITMKRQQYRADALIEVLHAAQEAFGYLEEDVLTYVARSLKLPLSHVYGVATFYHLFSLKPSGAHSCVVCMGTACYVKGGGKVMDALQAELGIEAGETTEDGKVSLMAARCLGACGIAPAVVFDGTVAGKLEPEAALARVKEWEA
ncbi:MAG: bidirectional hydrogenase complex protein HoxE [Synechococcales bacterium]|nr:bidirectional hydrogenase complex protein HoxE [Synechococcales bacterium]